MKIVVGMGSIDDYIEYVKAGADEIFIGYVPEDWQKRRGLNSPLNRREVCYYNVSAGSFSELEILADMMKAYGVPVSIALNGLSYPSDSYKEITSIIESTMSLGFNSYIIADLRLISYINSIGLSKNIKIHVSGELSEINHYMLKDLISLDASRLIFHRKVSLNDMKAIIESESNDIEYEAFMLNENCHFNGAFCNSLHCDELVPMCRMPYVLSSGSTIEETIPSQMLGTGGCGLCALYRLREAGITHLKIVGRGGYSDDIIRDIKGLKQALNILDTSSADDEYRKKMLQSLFNNNCSKDCYYTI